MTARDIDWSYLRGALRWVIAALLLCAAMLLLSGYYLSEQRRAFIQQGNERDAVRDEYLAAENQGRMIEEYYSRYQVLRRNGVIGVERRLDWIEAIQESTRRLRLPKIQYQIMPREPFSPANLPAFPGLTIYASRMKLDMELMHEGDLAAVVDNLERAGPGAVRVQSCDIRRVQEKPEMQASMPNLSASCQLLWFTIQPEVTAAAEGA